jgi:hypothetical protein
VTYPGLTSHRKRHDVAFQFHLVRLGFTSLREDEKTADPQDLDRRTIRVARRQQYREQLGSMRDLLHSLFD